MSNKLGELTQVRSKTIGAQYDEEVGQLKELLEFQDLRFKQFAKEVKLQIQQLYDETDKLKNLTKLHEEQVKRTTRRSESATVQTDDAVGATQILARSEATEIGVFFHNISRMADNVRALQERSLDQHRSNIVDSHGEASLEEADTKDPAKSASVQQIVAECQQLREYTLEASVFDCCTLIGLGDLSGMDSMLIAFSALLNLVLQSIFIEMIASGMTESLFTSDIYKQMYAWRGIYAHDITYANKFTNAPLVEEVCQGSGGLMNGVFQADLYSVLREYRQKNGEVLCMMAVMLWVFTVVKELLSIQRFTSAICSQSHAGSRPGSHLVSHEDGRLACEEVSILRAVALTVLVTFPRLVITILLGGVGIKYLVVTTGVGDLILNAMALEVVLLIDELLFAVIIPTHVSRLIGMLVPLSYRITRHQRWQYFFDWLKIAMITAIMVAIYILVLSPEIEDRDRVATVMCGGDTRFTSMEYANGIVYAGEVPKQNINMGYAFRAVMERATLEEYPEYPIVLSLPIPRGLNAYSVLEFSKHTLQRAFQDTACLDLHDKEEEGARQRILEMLSLQSGEKGQTCDDFKTHCVARTYVGNLVRAYCSHLCGCDNPLSGLVWNKNQDGCPGTCPSLRQAKLDLREGPGSIACQNVDPGSPALHSLMDQSRWMEVDAQTENALLHEFIDSHGCDVFIEMAQSRGCIGEGEALVALCPVTCGCLLQSDDTHIDEQPFLPGSNNCPKTCLS